MGSPSIACFAAALAAAAVLTPIVRRLALRWSFVDAPGDHRLHREPVPLLGGLALFAAIVGPLLLFAAVADPRRLAGVFAAAVLVTAVGLWDDRRRLPVAVRLLVQLAAAAILVSVGLFVDLELPAGVDGMLTVLWIVGVTNSFNLLDNMDGLAAGVAALAAAGFLILTMEQGGLPAALAAALAGASLGFLLSNFHPAKIFMGDAGSLLLGLLLAVLGLELQTGRGAREPWVAALVPVLVLAVPIFDTTLVTVSRWRRGRNPLTTPGHDHLSHRLRQRGSSVRGAVLWIYLAGGLGALLANLVARSGSGVAMATAIAVSVAGLWAVSALDRTPGRRT